MSVPPEVHHLFSKVPIPPGESLPSGVNDEEIRAFTERTGIPVPPQFREWLKLTNGPCIGPAGFYGIKPPRQELDIERMYGYDLYPKWRAEMLLPVAGDGTGNCYLLSAADRRYGLDHPVIFYDHEVEDVRYIVASDLWHFIEFVLGEELGERGWPFNREVVTGRDPAIQKCHGIPMPWEA